MKLTGELQRWALAVTATSVVALVGMGGCIGAEHSEDYRFDPSPIRFDTVSVIGLLDGIEAEMFGRIDDVAISPKGDMLAILDTFVPAVHVFTLHGTIIASVNAQGEGPGELQAPQRLAWLDDDALLVFDPSNGRISSFRVEDQGVRYAEQRPLRVSPRSVCLVGDRVFVASYQEAGVVHELGSDGLFLRTFGTPDPPGSVHALPLPFQELALIQFTTGVLYCDADKDLIVEVGSLQPRIRSFTRSGELIWAVVPDDVPAMEPVSDGRAMSTRIDEQLGAFATQSVVPWDDERILIQYGVHFPTQRPENHDFHDIESRWIRVDTGAQEHRSRDLPLIMAARGELALHVRNAPFPQVFVLRRIYE